MPEIIGGPGRTRTCNQTVVSDLLSPAETQFTSDYAAELKFIPATNEIEIANQFELPLIYLTNQSVREGKIDTFLYSRGFSGPS